MTSNINTCSGKRWQAANIFPFNRAIYTRYASGLIVFAANWVMLSLWSLPPFKYQNHETLWPDGPWWMSEWRGSVGIDMIPKWDIIQRKWGLNTACHSDLASRLPRAAGKGLLFPHMQQWRQAVWMTAQCQSLFFGGQRVNATCLEHNCWDMLGSLQNSICQEQPRLLCRCSCWLQHANEAGAPSRLSV